MSHFQLISENASVVVVGALNPAIVQPGWLAKHGVVTELEAKNAEIGVIIPGVSSFSVGPLVVEAQRSRLKLETFDPGRYVLLPDQIGKVLELLEHTPLTALGINRVVHYSAPSTDAWHGIGDSLSPKNVWEGRLESPGMLSLTMAGTRPGSQAAKGQVQIAPSTEVSPGVMISFNEHFEVSGAGPAAYAEVLRKNWQDALAFFKELERHVLSAPARSEQ